MSMLLSTLAMRLRLLLRLALRPLPLMLLTRTMWLATLRSIVRLALALGVG